MPQQVVFMEEYLPEYMVSQYETEEKVVLKLITRVFAARKAVRLRIEEEEEEAM